MSSRVLLVACGEPGIHDATEEFARRIACDHLDRVLLPGGCWWLAEAATATSGRLRKVLVGEHVPVRDALTRFIGDSGITRVILLGHQGCEWYRQRFPEASEGMRLKQAGADMFTARDELQRIAGPGLVIEGHLFAMPGGAAGSFHQVFPIGEGGAG